MPWRFRMPSIRPPQHLCSVDNCQASWPFHALGSGSCEPNLAAVPVRTEFCLGMGEAQQTTESLLRSDTPRLHQNGATLRNALARLFVIPRVPKGHVQASGPHSTCSNPLSHLSPTHTPLPKKG